MKKFTIIVMSLLLFSCKKDIDKIVELLNMPPGDFTVTVLNRDRTTAEIVWEKAIDIEGDSVTYSVELTNKIVASKLKTTNYKLLDLIADSSYNGRVIAIDSRGLETSTKFTILKHLEQILIAKGDYGGLVSFYPGSFTSWKVGYEVMTIPAVHKDTIFCGARDGLFAVNSATGKIYWKKEIRQNDNRSLVYYNGKLFLSATNKKIYALNSRNGETLWEMDGIINRNLVVNDNVLFVVEYFNIKAVDINSGSIKWQRTNTSEMLSTPVAKNGNVYLIHTTSPLNGYLEALDVQSGRQKWKFLFDGESLSEEGSCSPAIDNQLIYFPAARTYTPNINLVYAVNIENGVLAWKKNLVSLYDEVRSIAADDSGVYTSSSYNLLKLNKVNGDIIWSQKGNFNSHLTLANDKIYLNVDSKNYVTPYITKTGLKLESIAIAEYFYSTVVIKNGVVYYPSNSSMSQIN